MEEEEGRKEEDRGRKEGRKEERTIRTTTQGSQEEPNRQALWGPSPSICNLQIIAFCTITYLQS
jgi:hypothetical protein